MRDFDIQSCGVLRVRSEKLTLPSLRSFYDSASALIESGVRELLIDLSDVTYIDSAALGCLMDICRRMSGLNGVVKLTGLHERVRALVVIAGMTRHMGVPGESYEFEEHYTLVSYPPERN